MKNGDPGSCTSACLKVAEYQTRGLIHFHAVVRLDGPDGPDQPSPGWADLTLLADAITAAHTTAQLPPPQPACRRPVRYGDQIDLRPITEFGTGQQLTGARVAGYIAKYATKSAETAGTVDRPVRTQSAIPYLDVTDHARRMIHTCWLLADMPEYAELGLRRWSHMLGYRGHFLTKSRAYSTTFAALRDARIEHRRAEALTYSVIPRGTSTITARDWTYAGRDTNALRRS